MKILSLQAISGGYGREEILKDISFDICAGDFIGILGPNGSGKSTLLRMMSRVLTPCKGRIEFFGKKPYEINLRSFCQRTAFVPQDTLFSFSFTVWEITLMGRIPHLARFQSESKKDYAIAEKSLAFTDALHLRNKKINELSSGERQRVIIARALTQEPDLLFLDEPTSHLDICHQIQILDLLKRLNKETGMTIVMVVHDLNLASEYCGRIVLLNEGKIFQHGTPEEVLTYSNIEKVYKTVVLVNKNPLSGKPNIVLVPRDICLLD